MGLSSEELQKNELIYSLLTLKKAKYYWKQIQPADTDISPERFREQLSLEIAKFYSQNSKNPQYHISFLLNYLSA